ncbi:MAG: PEP-CTERM sorting domain-containing protein [Verrucomicrobiota bacterium]
MKTKLAILTAFLTTILSTSAAFVLDLGDLGGPSGDGAAYGISADGQAVVGYSNGTNAAGEAFRWTQAGGMEGLGNPPWKIYSSQAHAASDDGQVVVGWGSAFDGAHAFRWTSAGGMEDLAGTSSSSNSTAIAVSSNGSVIVGNAMWADTTTAFRWTVGGGMVSLGDFPGGETSSSAYGISADGVVVVGSGSTSNGYEAFRWTTTNGFESLGDLPGGDVDSWASAVSADGQVIVGSSDATNGYEAFLWTQSTGMVKLDGLAGFDDIEASAVSADGNTIVGFCSDSSGTQEMTAFIWTPAGGMQRLADVLAARGANLSHWQFLPQATGISEDGRWVCGYGVTTNAAGKPFLADISASVTLNIAQSNTAVIVSWPAPADGWVLESTNALPPAAVASWPVVPEPYQTNSGTISVTFTNTPATGSQFFRLHKP